MAKWTFKWAFTLVGACSGVTGADAAGRDAYPPGFDRLRVQGPFEVRVRVGGAVSARVEGDQEGIDGVDLQSEGGTLIVRTAMRRWQERPRAARASPVTIALTTPSLAALAVAGGARVNVDAMRASRIDLAVTGAGEIAVAAATADTLAAQVIGSGSVTVAGRAGDARLMTNGSGTIDADALDAGDLVVRLDGPGRTRARARYTASVTDTGIGEVEIAGHPKCTVRADAGGAVTCARVR